MLGKPWLETLVESKDQDQDITWVDCTKEDGCLILPAIEDENALSDVIISEGEDADKVLIKLRKKGWSTAGRTLPTLLNQVDPRFLHHTEHFERLTKGGLRASGVRFPGGGGLRWGGLMISGKEALLRVLGSFEYGDKQEQYQQTLRFSNFAKIAKAKGVTWSDKGRMLMKDRLKVHCDCPAFRYFYAFTADKKGFGLYPEVRPSNITNKEGKGGLCKHLHLVLQYLPTQSQKIAGELKAYYEKK